MSDTDPMNVWDLWKRGFAAWEGATASYFERVLSNPSVLGPAGAMLTAAMKTKTATDRAMSSWWSAWGLPNRRDQERALHKLNQMESRLYDLEERLEDARRWLADQDGDAGWLESDDEEALRLLVLVHRMAAARLGFPNLYSALNDRSSEDLSSGLIDGTAWVVRPFLSYVMPIALAREKGREFEIMRLLRKHCPRFQPEAVANAEAAGFLNALRDEITELAAMLQPGSGARIGDVVRFLQANNLLAVDERFTALAETFAQTGELVADPAPENATLRFMQCDAFELWGYRKYIEELSPFATQQGIKGAEFDKVLVVVDDQEGRSNAFSYGKYFGVTPLSETDQGHVDAGRDSVIGRTRRLFYVCCSRALSDLTVVIFAEDTAQMRDAIIAKAFFEPDSIHVFEQ